MTPNTDANAIIELIKKRQADRRSRAGFKTAGGNAEGAQVEFAIAEEYDLLLAEIEAISH